MSYKTTALCLVFGLLLFLISLPLSAQDNDFTLHIHIKYQVAEDAWHVSYELPIAVNHVAFSRSSNFDRSKLYRLDTSKFRWDQAGEVVLIRSIDGSDFTSLEFTFPSSYGLIEKDYTPNVRFSDGSVLLYSHHLALGANIIDDKAISPIGASFGKVQFHFYAAGQSIAFLGHNYQEQASWFPNRSGTYIYFGTITAMETDNLLAIVDPKLPSWVWEASQKYFPKLFDYYADNTSQPLSFKPMVFFNYDRLDGNFANYSGGTLDGLVQLTINGAHWQQEDSALFNRLFHFLAHEAAHFWNGEMFSVDNENHAWLHEGGADAFAYFAMRDFGLLTSEQMMQKFEEAANLCIVNKGAESLEQSAQLWRYRNYYNCGATMAFATHLAVKAKAPELSLFDVWQHIFQHAAEHQSYGQDHYFSALKHFTGSTDLSTAFHRFSTETDLDNLAEMMAWFEPFDTPLNLSTDYPAQMQQHWGQQVVRHLMYQHCNAISIHRYDDHLETDALTGCEPFAQSHEIHKMEGLNIFGNGAAAYQLFRERCLQNGTVTFQGRESETEVAIACLQVPPELPPYLRFSAAQTAGYW